jgi:chromosome segregation ATPase
MLRVASSAATALTESINFVTWLSEEAARKLGGVSNDDLAGLTAEYDRLAQRIKDSGWLVGAKQVAEWNAEMEVLYEKIQQANPATSDLAVNVAKVAKVTEAAVKPTVQLAKATETTSKGASKYVKELAAINKETDKIKARHEKATKAIEDGHEALDDMVKSTNDYIAGLEFELMLVGKSAKEQAILTAQREHGATATEAQREAITRLTSQLYEAQAATEAAAAAQKPFQDALQGTIERIDEAFTVVEAKLARTLLVCCSTPF